MGKSGMMANKNPAVGGRTVKEKYDAKRKDGGLLKRVIMRWNAQNMAAKTTVKKPAMMNKVTYTSRLKAKLLRQLIQSRP